MSIPGPFDTFTSGLVSIVRLTQGVTVTQTDPIQRSIKYLYDIENDRDCRQVRERLTELDLCVTTVLPAAPNSKIWSTQKYPPPPPSSSSSSFTLPHMVLANGQSLSGAAEILDYLDTKYPSSQSTDTTDQTLVATAKLILLDLGNYLAELLRYGRGRQVITAARSDYPEQPLLLYSYEGNQFCRLVREVLCELDVPYELRNAGKQSPRRAELAKRGSTLCPFLVDPNTGTSMPESKEIVAYLYQTYARWTPPNEVLQWASDVVLPTVRPLLTWVAQWQAGSRGADPEQYAQSIREAASQIEAMTVSHPVVVYTYDLSPFCTETKALLDRLKIEYKEVSLGLEWIPGLLKEPVLRAALLENTGQSSLPHIFIGGESIGGLFSGTPGLVPLLEQHQLWNKLTAAQSKSNVFGKKS
ncbi:anaphase-promoting complex subunit 7 [Fistulifera solaris]|uniref:Anaphase-promoting complex subunit 7 n=1 Tax=Fistulifera solaris TaxID=1519565 RepID=A0A1Z5KGW0_FISSO|nr:anaphase-promoting complex subunit 7 [Fistulifera solaris]|eukprot:GAX25560.1 anaphase-promoting complex subunit 7 [Fistulifera solaris]